MECPGETDGLGGSDYLKEFELTGSDSVNGIFCFQIRHEQFLAPPYCSTNLGNVNLLFKIKKPTSAIGDHT